MQLGLLLLAGARELLIKSSRIILFLLYPVAGRFLHDFCLVSIIICVFFDHIDGDEVRGWLVWRLSRGQSRILVLQLPGLCFLHLPLDLAIALSSDAIDGAISSTARR